MDEFEIFLTLDPTATRPYVTSCRPSPERVEIHKVSGWDLFQITLGRLRDPDTIVIQRIRRLVP